MVTKISMLLFYLRITKNSQKLLRIASYITLGIVCIAGAVLTFLTAFRCQPLHTAFSGVSSGKCISIVTLFLCSAPVNIITDLAILVLPIPMLSELQLPRRQKSFLLLTFALGIFVTIVDVVRIYYLQQADDMQNSSSRVGSRNAFSYSASLALMWSAVEVNVGIVCACIPMMRPLMIRILPSWMKDPTTSQGFRPTPAVPNSVIFHQQPFIANPAHGMRHLPSAIQSGNPEDEMYMVGALPAPPRVSHMTNGLPTNTSVYFDFIHMMQTKSMLETRGKESFKYCATVTILFSLWGFSSGLLNILNSEISTIAHQTTVTQTLGLAVAYWSGYFFGPLTVGQWVLRHGGFKATFICGLCIFGTGTLMFWPSAVLASFPGFIISNFVVAFGLSVLETAANPFLALCGPSRYAEYRLLLAQGVEDISSLLSQLLAQKALFANVVKHPSLVNVQWIYLALALFAVILALVFYYMPLPEATDADLQLRSDDTGIYPSTPSVLTPRLSQIYLTLALAVFAQFVYVGAQESVYNTWFLGLLAELSYPNSSTRLTLSPANYSLLTHVTFTLGRFTFAALCLILRPRILLLLSFCGGILFSALTTTLHTNVNGLAGLVLMFLFFAGPVWPLIFATGLRGTGKITKVAAACITAGASGGGVFPLVMWGIQRESHKTVQYSFCVIVALFAFGTVYPIYLSLVTGARKQVDDPVTYSSLEGDRQCRD